MQRTAFMKMFFSVLLFIAFFSCSCLLVEAKTLHGAWHYSGDSFSVDNEVIVVTHYGFYDTKVILKVNDRTYIIDEGDCELAPTKEYCVTDIFHNLGNASKSDPIKFEGGVAYAGIYIKVNTRGPELSVTRSFSTAEPELNDEVTVSVIVKNTGTEPASLVTYNLSLPEGVLLTSSSSGTERSSRRKLDLNSTKSGFWQYGQR